MELLEAATTKQVEDINTLKQITEILIADNWKDAVMRWTDGRGVDIILDCVGAQHFSDNLSCVAVDGVWVLYGLMGGAEVSGPILGG